MLSKRPKGSPQFINKLNKIRILNLIRENGQVSRADIARLSEISAPTVTRIVESLIKEEHLVKEIGAGESSGGRRPTLVEFAALDSFVIGVDIGTIHIDGILSNLNAKTVAEVRIETRIEDGFEKVMDRVIKLINELKGNSKVKGKKIFGVGLAVAGLVNRFRDVLEISPDFHWEDVNIRDALQDAVQLPIKFDNVTRVMSLGELWYGIGKEVKNYVVINLGYGIGSGLVIDGKLLYGPFGMAGEFGHMTMERGCDVRCECGNCGCLEALASGRAIAHQAQARVSDINVKSKMLDIVQGEISAITAETVAIAARQGDKIAKEIFSEAVEFIGIAISSLINLISPEWVLIGGGISQSGDLIFPRIREIVAARTIRTKSRDVRIEPVSFGLKAATKGAVALILNEVLSLKFNEAHNGLEKMAV